MNARRKSTLFPVLMCLNVVTLIVVLGIILVMDSSRPTTQLGRDPTPTQTSATR